MQGCLAWQLNTHSCKVLPQPQRQGKLDMTSLVTIQEQSNTHTKHFSYSDFRWLIYLGSVSMSCCTFRFSSVGPPVWRVFGLPASPDKVTQLTALKRTGPVKLVKAIQNHVGLQWLIFWGSVQPSPWSPFLARKLTKMPNGGLVSICLNIRNDI